MRISGGLGMCAAVTLMGALASLPGCGAAQDAEPNGFIDPTAVGRWAHKPLVVQVLNKMDVGIEEPNEEFPYARDVQPQDLVAIAGDYKIGKNDLVNVSVSDLTQQGVETVKTARVSESGNLSLPLIGSIHADGMTEAELEKAVAAAYRDANIITSAQVSVTVSEARARTFSILGAVSRPAQYQIVTSDFRMLDALVLTGDVAQGSEWIYVVRARSEEAATQPTTAPTSEPTQDMLAPDLAPKADARPRLAPNPALEGGWHKPNTVALAKLSHRPLMMDQEAADKTPATPAAPAGTSNNAAPPATNAAPATSDQDRVILLEGKQKTLPAAPSAEPAAAAPNAASTPGAAPAPAVAPVAQDQAAPAAPNAAPATPAPTVAQEPAAPATQNAAPTAVAPVPAPATAETTVAPAPTTESTLLATTEPASAPTTEATTAPTTEASAFEFNELIEPTDKIVIRVPVMKLRNGELKYNIVIRPNDMLMVPGPVVGEYYMGGHIGRVGVYSLTGRYITLKQAVISAGMFDQLAVPNRTEIIRRIGTDKEVFARVNLARIFAGEDSDIYLKPNDIVNVGTTIWAPFVAATRSAFRITYGFGFLYDKNFSDTSNNNNNNNNVGF